MPHQVVAVERDVERAGRDLVAVDLADRLREPPGDRHAARADADERQLVDAAVALDDLVRDAGRATRHAIGVEGYRHSAANW